MDRLTGELIQAVTNVMVVAMNNREAGDYTTYLMLRGTISGLVSALKVRVEEGKCPPTELEYCEKMLKKLYITEDMRDLCDNE